MSNAKPSSLDAQLLTDLQDYFARQSAKHYPTEQLLAYLAGIHAAPWATFADGKAITARHLARLLQPYGIVPKTIRFMGGLAKGYTRADFADAFARSFVTDKVADIVDVTDRIESAKGDVTDKMRIVTDRRPVLADSGARDSDVTDKVADIVDVTDKMRIVTDRRPVLADSVVTDSVVTDNVVDKVDVTDRNSVVADKVAAPAPVQPVRKWPPPKGWTWNYKSRCYEPPKSTVQPDPPDQALIRQTLCISPELKYLPGYGLVAAEPHRSA